MITLYRVSRLDPNPQELIVSRVDDTFAYARGNETIVECAFPLRASGYSCHLTMDEALKEILKNYREQEVELERQLARVREVIARLGTEETIEQ